MPLAIGWFVWRGLLGVLYLIAFITAGVMTIRNGHLVMFIIQLCKPEVDGSIPARSTASLQAFRHRQPSSRCLYPTQRRRSSDFRAACTHRGC